MPVIRITADRRLALTLEQAAARKGVAVSSMRGEISRYKVPHIPDTEPDMGDRKKLYWAKDIDAMWKKRPGVGSPGRKRKPADHG